MHKKVYLAGPITGLTYDGAQDWRDAASARLQQHDIVGVSPLRAKSYLRSVGEISGHGREYAHMGPMSTPKGVTTRDRYDATTCDVLLANLLGADRVSIGTMIELGWADANRIPVVLAIEDGNMHDHMMVNEIAGFRATSIDAALDIVVAILGGPRQ